MEKIVFLDRDGVINRDLEVDYVRSVSALEVFDFVPAAVRRINDAGFKVVIISNQAGVGKGLYSQQDLDEITREINSRIEAVGGRVDRALYCTHRSDENCACRKPRTGLLEQAMAGREVERKNSFMIGDSEKDIAAGQSMGLRTMLVFSGKTKPGQEKSFSVQPDFIVKDLAEAAELIQSQGSGARR